MKSIMKAFSLFIIAQMFLLQLPAQEKFKPRYNFEKGKTLKYETKASVKGEYPNNSGITLSEYDLIQSFENSDAPDGINRISMQYSKYNLKTVQEGEDPVMDKGKTVEN